MAGYNNSITDINSKVGIGTGQTEPASKLEVNGVTVVRGGSFSTPNDARSTVGLVITENDFIYTLDSNGAYLRKLIGKVNDVITIGEAGTSLIDGINLTPGTTGGYVQIFNNASVAAKFVNENLSLGMSDPQQKLHIVDTDGANIILNSNTGSENNGIWMTEGGIATPYANGVYLHYDSTNNAFKINTGTSSLTTKFTIKRDTGDVGIGTITPDAKLEVAGGTTGILLSNLGDSSAYDAVAMTYNGYNSGTPEFIFKPKTNPGSGTVNSYFRFQSRVSGGSNISNVTVDGQVGIGTDGPSAKLHIAKTTTWGEMSNPIINIQNNGTGGNINTAHNMGSITWKSGSVSTAEIKAVRNTPASGDNVELRFSTSDAGTQGERMTIKNDGVVLINNSLGINVTSVSTGYKLDIGWR